MDSVAPACVALGHTRARPSVARRTTTTTTATATTHSGGSGGGNSGGNSGGRRERTGSCGALGAPVEQLCGGGYKYVRVMALR